MEQIKNFGLSELAADYTPAAWAVGTGGLVTTGAVGTYGAYTTAAAYNVVYLEMEAIGMASGEGLMTTFGAMTTGTVTCISLAAFMAVVGIGCTTWWANDWSYDGAYFKTL
jgi:hypothetical protein